MDKAGGCEGVPLTPQPLPEDRNAHWCLHETQRNNSQASVTELMKVWESAVETPQVRRVPWQWAVLPGNKGECKDCLEPRGLDSLLKA